MRLSIASAGKVGGQKEVQARGGPHGRQTAVWPFKPLQVGINDVQLMERNKTGNRNSSVSGSSCFVTLTQSFGEFMLLYPFQLQYGSCARAVQYPDSRLMGIADSEHKGTALDFDDSLRAFLSSVVVGSRTACWKVGKIMMHPP